MMLLTKIIVAECLDNLRYEEEGQFDWVLLENAMGVLEEKWVVPVPFLEECDRDDRWNRRPDGQMLESFSQRGPRQ